MTDKTIDHGFAKFSLGDDGIIRVVYSDDIDITLNEVEKGGDALKQLCQGKKRPVFVDARSVRSMSRDARLHSLCEDSGTPVVSAVATLNKPVLRILGGLFVKIIAPPYPLKFFSTEAEAVDWLKGYIK